MRSNRLILGSVSSGDGRPSVWSVASYRPLSSFQFSCYELGTASRQIGLPVLSGLFSSDFIRYPVFRRDRSAGSGERARPNGLGGPCGRRRGSVGQLRPPPTPSPPPPPPKSDACPAIDRANEVTGRLATFSAHRFACSRDPVAVVRVGRTGLVGLLLACLWNPSPRRRFALVARCRVDDAVAG